MNVKRWLSLALPHGALVLASVVAIYPVLWVLKMALSPGQAFDSSPNPLPTELTFDNFGAFVGAPLFWRQLFNSLAVAGATTVIRSEEHTSELSHRP